MLNQWNNTIVISAVNLVDGGTFTILKECLEALSSSQISGDYRVVALVHSTENLPVDGIEYIEYPKSKKNYLLRIYYEYVAFKKLSKKLRPKLWLSLHDMSPRVEAEAQAVYMHNPSPFLGRPKSLSLRDIGFSSLYKYIYRINIYSNKYLIVQQNWLRESFSEMFRIPKEKIIVARPSFLSEKPNIKEESYVQDKEKVFVYASYPRNFKNFELICAASKILDNRGIGGFRVKLTIDGSENNYSKRLVTLYKSIKCIEFIGLQPRTMMPKFYSESDCLIFPSKAETWGLPISEYKQYNKPMILADLPYAHETAAGASFALFTNPDDAAALASKMEQVIKNDFRDFASVPIIEINAPKSNSWVELFSLLLK